VITTFHVNHALVFCQQREDVLQVNVQAFKRWAVIFLV
jgi:hypothetical protein